MTVSGCSRTLDLRQRNVWPPESDVSSVAGMSQAHCTGMLTVAVLLARFESGVSAMVAAFSVITVPAAAVTLTVSRTVHVVFGAMLPFS